MKSWTTNGGLQRCRSTFILLFAQWKWSIRACCQYYCVCGFNIYLLVNFRFSNSAIFDEKEFFFLFRDKNRHNSVIYQLRMLHCNISNYTRRDSVAGVDRKIGGFGFLYPRNSYPNIQIRKCSGILNFKTFCIFSIHYK